MRSFSLIRTAWLLLFFLTGPVTPCPGDILRLDSGVSRHILGHGLEVLEDRSGTLSIGEVSTPPWSDRFRPYEGKTLCLGVTKSAWWVRLTIAENPGDAEAWFLEIDRIYIASLRVYLSAPAPDDCQTIWNLGYEDTGEFTAKHNYTIPLPDDLSVPRTVYLRAMDHVPLFFPLEVRTEEASLAVEKQRMIWLGLYSGIVFTLAIYNLFLFLSLRDRSYLWYGLYISSLALFFLGVNGITHAYLLNSTPAQGIRLDLGFLAFTLVGLGFFARTFLLTRRYSPAFDRILLGVTVAGSVLAALTPFLDLRTLNHLFSLQGIAIPPILISAAAVCLRRGFRPARFFLLAWTFPAAGLLVYTLTLNELLPMTVLTLYSFQIGTIFETVLLSFALADRIKSLQRESEEARRGERRFQVMAITDALTGLYNARYFHDCLDTEIVRAAQVGQCFALLMIDVDNFKRLNDSRGHPEGDRLLARLGGTIRTSIRDRDTAFRYGGEEFAVILRDSGMDDALQVAERIRTVWEGQINSSATGENIHPTISIGVGEHHSGATRAELVHRADQALYRAKRQGKNCCRAWDQPVAGYSVDPG